MSEHRLAQRQISEHLNGWTFYICGGEYAGWTAWWNHKRIGVLLGWVSISLVWYDVERFAQVARSLLHDHDGDIILQD